MAGSGPVVVIGANGLVGAEVVRALLHRGAQVRGVVRRAGLLPTAAGLDERVGDFTDERFLRSVLDGASAVVTTVHPMGTDRATQHRVGVEGTATVARVAAELGLSRLVHVSTTAVYERLPATGDVDESSTLVDDDAADYAFTKRETDLALARVDGITRVVIRPPAILGPGESSTWNTLRPAAIRDDPDERRAAPHQTYAWVHVTDLAGFAADLALGAAGPAGPVEGECTIVNVAGEPATLRDYVTTVTDALGVEPVWHDAPAWTGQIVTDRARSWGWRPEVDLRTALAELAAGLRA